MAKLVDALDLGSSGATCGSSSLPVRTFIFKKIFQGFPLETKLNSINSIATEVEVHLAKEEYDPFYKSELSKAQAKIEMPGFRKGKVPVSMIQKQFGKSIEIDALLEAVDEKVLKGFAETHKINLAGAPQLKDFHKNEEGGYKVVLELEHLPNIELKDYKNLTIEEPVHVVEDSEIDKVIEELCLTFAKFEPANEIEDNKYTALVKTIEVDKESNEPVANAKEDVFPIYMEEVGLVEEVRTNLLNKKSGDFFYLNPSEIGDKSGVDKLIRFEITEIMKVVPAELNDEFISMATNNKFTNEADLRTELGFRVQEQWDNQARSIMKENIYDTLLELHGEFELPKITVANVLENMYADFLKENKMPGNDNLKQQFFTANEKTAQKLTRVMLLKDTIMEAEKIEVEESDIEEILNEYKAMGLFPAEMDIAPFMERFKSDERVTTSILDKKFGDLMMDFSTTNEVPFEQGKHPFPTVSLKNLGIEIMQPNQISDETEHVHDENCGHNH